MRPTEVPGHVASPHPIPGWQVKDIGTIVAALAEKGVHMKFYDGMGQDAQGIWTGPDETKVAFFNDPDGNALSLARPA